MLGRDGRLRFNRMSIMVTSLPPQSESAVGELLMGIVTRFGGALEFWTLVCLSRNELGNPTQFVDRQWSNLLESIQELRSRLAERDYEPPPTVQEQIAKLIGVSAELREVFDHFIAVATVSQKDLEASVLRLAHVWQEVRMRVWLLGTLIPLPQAPVLSMEREAYYQGILDGLIDQFLAARHALSEGHERNGKPS
jgi:hypothetical protein